MSSADRSAPVAVIGAGLAGLAAAHGLRELGLPVKLFDKARGPGGRCSTRRARNLQFDHGAQFFTAREGPFVQAIGPLLEAGLVKEWSPRICRLDAEGRRAPAPDSARYVGVPGMNALGKGLSADLDLERGARIRELRREPDGAWTLVRDGAEPAGPFRAAVVTCPAPQAADLLVGVSPDLAEACENAEFLPCWSVMAAFDRPLDLDLDAAFVDDEVLAWLARESSKPGRAMAPECWTLHAGPEWSARHLEDEPGIVAEAVLGRFGRLTGALMVRPVHVAAHRWRYARAAQPAHPDAARIDAGARIAVAGDWQRGDRIEDAFMSGRAAASELARAMDSAR